ncbi:hypothetical protein [Sphingomonas sp. TWP1-3-1]|uniref:hypothetical protein n=1 Tax=Sphingomonas sp. TWP1-3-1 TaxID=2804612 RepID=UPI003CF7FCD8
MLATLCAAVHWWNLQKRPVATWLPAAEVVIASDPPRSKPADQMQPAELLHYVEAALADCDRRVIPDQNRFTTVLRAMNLLDDWHEPLMHPAPGGLLPTPAHEDALVQLGRGRGYNSDPSIGIMIPLSCEGMAPIARPPRTSAPNAVLQSTTYVPPFLAAGDPDGEDLASLGRTVAVRYRPPSLLRIDPRPAPGSNPVVAVAPVHQDPADAAVISFTDPDRYGLAVMAGVDRLPAIIGRAVDEGAHMVFLPEMAVEESQLGALADLIQSLSTRHFRTYARLPALRYVVAGCVSRADPGDFGRNFVVVLDHEGVEVARQHKLSRWNLKAHHQFSYGLTPVADPDAGELFENIAAGEEVWIVDLPGIGRMSTLICADMSHNDPGDFLINNVGLDWLHAPIMDRTNVVIRASLSGQPWMIDRALRAAQAGVRRVVVTNSVLFTALINETNSRPGSSFAPYARCSIAFMLETDTAGLKYRDVAVDMPPAGTIVDIARWSDGFKPFPPP